MDEVSTSQLTCVPLITRTEGSAWADASACCLPLSGRKSNKETGERDREKTGGFKDSRAGTPQQCLTELGTRVTQWKDLRNAPSSELDKVTSGIHMGLQRGNPTGSGWFAFGF